MEAFGEFLGQLLFYTVLFACKAVVALVRLAARATAAFLPSAHSLGAAAGYALLAAGAWTLLIALPFALAGGADAFGFGLVLGALVGCCIGYAVFVRGRAQVAAQSGAVQFGERPGALGVPQPHVVERAARVRHVAVFGPTGSGKSTVLKNLVLQDAAAPGRPGLLVVDVKDDLVLDIAARLPAARVGDVLLFDPADTAFPPAFNPFAGVPEAGRTLAAAELVSALKRLYADAWGPRLEHVLRMTVLTLLETPDATLLDIARLLTDSGYRSWALPHVTNFSVSQFWEREWPSIAGKGDSVANVESLLNKLSVFAYPEVRNVVGQTSRGLDIRPAIDEGKIVLAHLPQGVLGEDAAHFLAALLVGKVQLAAQSRVDLPHARRRTCYVFADEFQNYETSALGKLITEGRSMGVGVVAACQFREQLDTSLRLALEKNCAYGLTCRLVSGKHTVTVLKLQEPDAPDAAVLLRPLPPPRERAQGQLAAIREQSRRTLSRPRAAVEATIAARMLGQHQQPPIPRDHPERVVPFPSRKATPPPPSRTKRSEPL